MKRKLCWIPQVNEFLKDYTCLPFSFFFWIKRETNLEKSSRLIFFQWHSTYKVTVWGIVSKENQEWIVSRLLSILGRLAYYIHPFCCIQGLAKFFAYFFINDWYLLSNHSIGTFNQLLSIAAKRWRWEHFTS